jgi:hypothetical protein
MLVLSFLLLSNNSCAALDRQAASVAFVPCRVCYQIRDNAQKAARGCRATMRLSASDQDVVDGDVDCERERYVSSLIQKE